MKAREEAAIRKMKEKDATRGKGVTKEAQEVFDMIGRTYVLPQSKRMETRLMYVWHS